MSEQVQLVLFLLREMLILAVVAVPLALIPAYLAKKKSRSFTLWFLYGLFAYFYAFVCFDVWWYTGKEMLVLLLLGIALAVLPVLHAWVALPAVLDREPDHDLMFGKMVTSNAQLVGDDRNIYFYDTMGVWVTVAFLIVAVTGVLMVNARLSSTGENITLVATPPPPVAAAPPAPQPKVKPQEIPQFASVKEAPKEIKTNVAKPPPPQQTYFESAPGSTAGAGDYAPGTVVLPSSGGGEPPPPPPPPPPPKEEPKPEPPKIVRKSGGVLQGSATRRVEPSYPPLAKTARISGAVVVEVTVDEAGNVISARALSGHPLLKDSAVNAARGWKFTPTQLSGVPVKVIGTITFNFTL